MNEEMYSIITESSEIIGEGRFRQVRLSGDFVVKSIKPMMRKNFPFGSVMLPTAPYVALKYGIMDFNKQEQINYKKLVKGISDDYVENFAPIIWTGLYAESKVLIQKSVRDFDGDLSSSLYSIGGFEDALFWDRLDEIAEQMISTGNMLMDIRGENVMIKKEKDGAVPVIVDYKRMGAQTYPFQPWLRNNETLRAKFERRYDRFRSEYRL